MTRAIDYSVVIFEEGITNSIIAELSVHTSVWHAQEMYTTPAINYNIVRYEEGITNSMIKNIIYTLSIRHLQVVYIYDPCN